MSTPKSLIIRYLMGCVYGLILIALPGPHLKAEEPAPYAAWFDPAKGFKPAQANFQLIFLQMAGSFEFHGSPEPYIRHILNEHARIDTKRKNITGRTDSSRPSYFTDDYLQKLVRSWNRMASILTLESLTRQSGANMRYAIMGSWNMSVPEMVALENNLPEDGREVYGKLLKKNWFTKADFPALEVFYGSSYDRLTEDGKNRISRRTRLGQLTPEQRNADLANDKGGTMLLGLLQEHQRKSLTYLEDRTQPKADSDTLRELLTSGLKLSEDYGTPAGLRSMDRDAFRYSHLIRAGFKKRLDHVRLQAKEPGQADAIENALTAMIAELAVLAQSEYEAALYEGLLDRKPKAN